MNHFLLFFVRAALETAHNCLAMKTMDAQKLCFWKTLVRSPFSCNQSRCAVCVCWTAARKVFLQVCKDACCKVSDLWGFRKRRLVFTTQPCSILPRNCAIPVVCVRTLGIVGSQTQLSLRCNFSDYVFRNNYMFRPMMTILSSTCLTINYLYFLIRYSLLYFSIHSGVHFGLFLICDLFSVCFICASSHTCKLNM